MKILIISDTHREHDNLDKVLEQEKPLDFLLHLGDAAGKEDYIEAVAECPVEVVAGNNDFGTRLPSERVLQIGKYQVLMTHGHYYYVNAGITRIRNEAISRGIDIVMFGHTHCPLLENEDGITILNPGSISFPRQANRKPSYIVMNLDENGEANFSIKYVE